MNALMTWLAMGGYAVFVWPAYAVTALVLGGLALVSWLRHRRSGAALARIEQQAGRQR